MTSCSRLRPRPPLRAESGSSPASTRRFPSSCGIDVALILDLSGSVGTGARRSSRRRPNTFVDALAGHAVADVALLVLDDQSGQRRRRQLPEPHLGVDPRAGAPRSRTATRRGRRAAPRTGTAGSGSRRRPTAPRTTSTSRWSSPTATPPSYNQPAQGSGSTNRFRETENGIFSANALKQGPAGAPAPTRVLAFGVGDGAIGAANALNIRAISGPTPYNGTQR